MKSYRLLLLVLILTFSCEKEVDIDKNTQYYDNGYFIVNAGNFRPRKPASVQFVSFDGKYNSYDRDIYSNINDEHLEGLLIDMTIQGEYVYLLLIDNIDNSNCIIIADRRTFKKVKEIDIAIENPKSFVIKNNKAFVFDNTYSSTYNSETISIVDLQNEIVIKDITVPANTNSKMVLKDNHIYLLSKDVIEIDTNTNNVSNIFVTGNGPTSLVAVDDYLYLTFVGGENPYTGGICKININTGEITNPIELSYRYTKNILYENGLFILTEHDLPHFLGEVYTWDGESHELIGPILDKDGYALMTIKESRLALRESLLYHAVESLNGGCTVFDFDDNSRIRSFVTGYNPHKIVFNQ